jgi:hypothetical protein
MKMLFILSLSLFLTSAVFAQQTSTDAVKKTITTLEAALHKGDSTLLRFVLAKDMELQDVDEDETGKRSLSATSANELVKEIGTPHTDVYDELNIIGDIKIEGPLAIVRTSYKFYIGSKFDHCGIHYFQLAKIDGSWKIILIAATSRIDKCPV